MIEFIHGPYDGHREEIPAGYLEKMTVRVPVTRHVIGRLSGDLVISVNPHRLKSVALYRSQPGGRFIFLGQVVPTGEDIRAYAKLTAS